MESCNLNAPQMLETDSEYIRPLDDCSDSNSISNDQNEPSIPPDRSIPYHSPIRLLPKRPNSVPRESVDSRINGSESPSFNNNQSNQNDQNDQNDQIIESIENSNSKEGDLITSRMWPGLTSNLQESHNLAKKFSKALTIDDLDKYDKNKMNDSGDHHEDDEYPKLSYSVDQGLCYNSERLQKPHLSSSDKIWIPYSVQLEKNQDLKNINEPPQLHPISPVQNSFDSNPAAHLKYVQNDNDDYKDQNDRHNNHNNHNNHSDHHNNHNNHNDHNDHNDHIVPPLDETVQIDPRDSNALCDDQIPSSLDKFYEDKILYNRTNTKTVPNSPRSSKTPDFIKIHSRSLPIGWKDKKSKDRVASEDSDPLLFESFFQESKTCKPLDHTFQSINEHNDKSISNSDSDTNDKPQKIPNEQENMEQVSVDSSEEIHSDDDDSIHPNDDDTSSNSSSDAQNDLGQLNSSSDAQNDLGQLNLTSESTASSLTQTVLRHQTDLQNMIETVHRELLAFKVNVEDQLDNKIASKDEIESILADFKYKLDVLENQQFLSLQNRLESQTIEFSSLKSRLDPQQHKLASIQSQLQYLCFTCDYLKSKFEESRDSSAIQTPNCELEKKIDALTFFKDEPKSSWNIINCMTLLLCLIMAIIVCMLAATYLDEETIRSRMS